MAKPGWKRNPTFKRQLSQIIAVIPDSAAAGARVALEKNGNEAEGIIKSDAPVDDGDLRDSVGWKFGDPPPGTLGVRDAREAAANSGIPEHLRISIFAGGKKAPHAHLVHNGTAQRVTKDGEDRGIMPPQPFFWPNIRSLRKRFRGRISREMLKGLRKGLK